MTQYTNDDDLQDPDELLTVGQVAARFGITVRTLHHYDAIGLVVPSERSSGGYRQYTNGDLTRLQDVVVYRRLGFSLDEVADLLAARDESGDVTSHLKRQHETVLRHAGELAELADAIERALEKQMNNVNLTKAEQRELFGNGFSDEYAAEAQERWGDTPAWQQSNARTRDYTKADWERIAAEANAINERFASALKAGEAPTSEAAMDAAEAHRLHIHSNFYDLGYDMHRGLGRMYVDDPRFAKNYEDIAPGLAEYVHQAIDANADRHQQS